MPPLLAFGMHAPERGAPVSHRERPARCASPTTAKTTRRVTCQQRSRVVAFRARRELKRRSWGSARLERRQIA